MFRPIPPAEISAVWWFVLPGLEEVIRITKEQWTPTHIMQGVNEGWAHLFLADDGFVVLQVPKEDWTSERYLQVWAMWFKPNRAEEMIEPLTAWLHEMRERAGVRYWKFGSPRMGWATRKLKDKIEIERIVWRSKAHG